MSHFDIVEHTIQCQHFREYPGAVQPGQDLRLAIKQYIPKTNSKPVDGDITIIGAHANGFPKELYEPLWDDLYEKLEAMGTRIRSIWIADVAQQGQSGILNEKILGNDPCWFDHARDLLHMINGFRRNMVQPIVGIGHSMGGMQLVHLSLIHPSLFQALVLIKPVIQRSNPAKSYALASTYRRDLWASRQDAVNSFKTSPFYQRWDRRVLTRWIEYGLRSLPTQQYPKVTMKDRNPVTLTTTKAQEVFTFLRPRYQDPTRLDSTPRGECDVCPDDVNFPFYRPEPAKIFHSLPEVTPSVLYIFGATSELSSSEARRQKIERTGIGRGGSGGVVKGRVQEFLLPCGHLIPLELVTDCAIAAGSFLQQEQSRWIEYHEVEKGYRQQTSTAQQNYINDKWKEQIGSLPLRKKPKDERNRQEKL